MHVLFEFESVLMSLAALDDSDIQILKTYVCLFRLEFGAGSSL